MTELTALCRELDQRRTFAGELAAFLDANPAIDEQFAAFQRQRSVSPASSETRR